MAIKHTIEADKEGFLGYLTEQRDTQLELSEHSHLQRDKDRHRWEAEGLTRAIRAVENWEIIVASKPPEPKSSVP